MGFARCRLRPTEPIHEPESDPFTRSEYGTYLSLAIYLREYRDLAGAVKMVAELARSIADDYQERQWAECAGDLENLLAKWQADESRADAMGARETTYLCPRCGTYRELSHTHAS